MLFVGYVKVLCIPRTFVMSSYLMIFLLWTAWPCHWKMECHGACDLIILSNIFLSCNFSGKTLIKISASHLARSGLLWSAAYFYLEPCSTSVMQPTYVQLALLFRCLLKHSRLNRRGGIGQRSAKESHLGGRHDASSLVIETANRHVCYAERAGATDARPVSE